ncbi:MAG: FHA domain-containing protein [Planctomycetota bacterium]|nr:FHA domain-containing protein [Planctomycetota bacterium]
MPERQSLNEFVKTVESMNRLLYLQEYDCPALLQITSEDGQALPLEEQKRLLRKKVRRVTQDLLKTSLETSAFFLPDRKPITASFFFIRNSNANENRSFIGVGTDPTCDLTFPEEDLSLRHGFFKAVKGMSFTDAGSKNGTFVNGAKLDPRKSKKLSNHDEMRFGEHARFIYMSVHGFYEFVQACALATSSNKAEAQNKVS